MSTEIGVIEGTCHVHSSGKNSPEDKLATVYLTRFFNGGDKGVNIQLTISQDGPYGTSYVHLTKEKCEELAKVLLECFDTNKYPSD